MKNSHSILLLAGWLATGLEVVPLRAAAPARSAPADYADDESRAEITPNSPSMAWWRESMKTRDERLAWWREARFGMFIHWGVYSGLGGVWKDQKLTTGYLEHIQRRLKIPIAEYRADAAGKFNPTNFNASAWVRLAKEAGMGYLIITAKHHDGFAMFDSQASDYNIVQATPFKRDPMKELRDACREQGVRFGFYYSHAFDWGEANGPGNDWDFDNPGGDKLLGGAQWWKTRTDFIPKARKYVDEKSIPQLRELIKNYEPDIFWFDTPHKLPPSENVRIMKAVRAASPRVVINGRLVRGFGDYDSTSDRPAEFPPHERDWEGVPTTNESYGWSPFDLSHKPPGHFVGLLAKAVARGGNTLMNIGPMGDGRIDPKDVAILQGIGRWWKTNGESIRGAGRTPLPVQAWGESTRKGNTLYLQVFAWPKNGQLVVGGLKTDVKRACLLADAQRTALKVARLNPLDVRIDVPASAPDSAVSVIAVECAGEPVGDTSRLLQPVVSIDVLRAFDAVLEGKTLKYADGKSNRPYVENWVSQAASVRWPVRLNETGTYAVAVAYDADTAGNLFAVKLGDQTLTGAVRPGKAITQPLGTVKLAPGRFDIQMVAQELKRGELMKLRGLTLTSATP